mgnify:CR=1 FL=1
MGASIAKLVASFSSFVFVIFALNKVNFKLTFGKVKLIIWSLLLSVTLFIISTLPIYVYLILSLLIITTFTLITKFYDEKELLIFFKLIRKETIGEKIILLLNKKIKF